MRYAVVFKEQVENIIVLVDGQPWMPGEGRTIHPLQPEEACDIGWKWDGAPVEPVPETPVESSPVTAPPQAAQLTPAQKLATFLAANPDVQAMIDS